MIPLFVTFDTNAYDRVVSPKLGRIFEFKPLSKDRRRIMTQRVAGTYVGWCIRQGRVFAAIPEAALEAEVVPNADRVAFIKSFYIGTPKPSVNVPGIGRVRKALAMGFKILHGGRIGYGQIVGVADGQWASDKRHPIDVRQQRFSICLRSFSDGAYTALKDFGEELAAVHGIHPTPTALSRYTPTADPALWVKGLDAEEQKPKKFPSVQAFRKAMQQKMADWADFDIVCAHYAYDFDYLCTADAGRTHASSVLGAAHSAQLDQLGIKTLSLPQLAQLCWCRYGFPLVRWSAP